MDIEEAIQSLKFSTYSCLPFGSVMANKEAIETVLNELERLKKYENLEWQEFNELAVKDKIIEEMAKTINKEYYKDIIENYTKKVEGK